MIGVSGLARSGKNTLAENLSEVISEDLGVKVKTFASAFEPKKHLDDFLKSHYGISAFTEDQSDKKTIRDFVLLHAETMKKVYGKSIWLDLLFKKIHQESSKTFPIITDVRFDFEAEAIQKQNGVVIHISKIGNLAPNEIEKQNDPLVSKVSNLKHTWPNYRSSELKNCRDHAEILWQMAKQTHGKIWKKIYC